MTRPAFRRDGEEGDVLFAGQEQKTQRSVRMAQTAFSHASADGTKKRTVHMGTVRFVQRVCDTRRSGEEQLSRK